MWGCRVLSFLISLVLSEDALLSALVFCVPAFGKRKRKGEAQEAGQGEAVAAALEAAVLEDEQGRELTEIERVELQRVLRVYKYCMVCSGGSIRPEGWAHKSRTKHAMRALTVEERKQLEVETRKKLTGGPAATKEAFERSREQQQQREQEVAQLTQESAHQRGMEVYKFECGQFRRKTIAEVMRAGEQNPKHKDYIPWCLCSKLHTSGRLPGLERALKDAGLWEGMAHRAQEMVGELRARDLAKKAEVDVALACGEDVHKDIVRMRSLRADIVVAQTAAEETDGVPSWSSAIPTALVQSKPRAPHKSKALTLLTHCRYCGLMGHKTPTCPKALEDAADPLKVRPTGVIQPLQKKLWRTTAHLKYTWIQNRTAEYENKAAKRVRGEVVRSGDELTRMTVRQFCLTLFEDGLLLNLEGMPCTDPRCPQKVAKFCVGQPMVLGPWRVLRKNADLAQSVRPYDATYRCKHCRRRYPLSFGQPLYSPTDCLDEVARSFWNFVEDAPLTYTCRQMNRDEGLIRRYYRTALKICEWDALRRQAKYVFGRRGPLTATIEADCSRFGKFEAVEDGRMAYYSWVVIGVITRGDPCGLWLREYPRLTKSLDVSRVAPEEAAVWREVCDELFNDTTHAVLMTDSAGAFNTSHPGIVEHYSVNHSEKEWTRPEPAVLANVETGERQSGMAGTPLLDSTWGRLKGAIPRGLAVHTPADRALKMSYIRAAQWKLMLGSEDRWTAFCKAAKDWNAMKAGDFAKSVKSLVPLPRPWLRKNKEAQASPNTALGGARNDCQAPLPLTAPTCDGSGRAHSSVCSSGWQCTLLGKGLGEMDYAPAWFNDDRTGGVGRSGTQTALTCGLHAVSHLIFAKGTGEVVKRLDFEARCREGVQAGGNYGYADMHRNLAAYGCNMEVLSADVVETMAVRSDNGDWVALFQPGTLEASRVLGYLVHAPGHWIAIIPGGLGAPEHVGMLCDSLFNCIFNLTGEEIAELLEAMACYQQEKPDDPHGVWSAYRAYMPQQP